MNAVWYLRKLVRLTFLLCCFCFLIGCSSSSNNVDKKIYVETDKSYLSDYVIQDEKVIFWCNIQIVNLYQEQKWISISGLFKEDEKTGLIMENTLLGRDSNNYDLTLFHLKPGINNLSVVFVGTHGISNIKHDRLLPQIIVNIEKESG